MMSESTPGTSAAESPGAMLLEISHMLKDRALKMAANKKKPYREAEDSDTEGISTS